MYECFPLTTEPTVMLCMFPLLFMIWESESEMVGSTTGMGKICYGMYALYDDGME
jgi:hypothetical protein